MANRYATKSGNWSDVTVWDGGTTLPTTGDVVRPNGFTVTIDQDINLGSAGELTNNASSPAVSGGAFTWLSTKSIVGNITNRAGGFFVSVSGTSTPTITGNISSLNGYALSAGNVNVTGNVYATGGRAIDGYTGGTIVGNVYAEGSASALVCSSSVSIAITGNVYCTGSGNAITLSTGTLSITGTVTASLSAAAVSASAAALVIVNGDLVDGSAGHRAVDVRRLFISATLTIQHQIVRNNGGIAGSLRSLYTGGTNLGQPTAANVRSGTVFGASSEYTGTLAVPSPTLVAIGVATDNTVGSYLGITSADLNTALAGIPKVGQTHRYTQVASTSTTTDVLIGVAT